MRFNRGEQSKPSSRHLRMQTRITERNCSRLRLFHRAHSDDYIVSRLWWLKGEFLAMATNQEGSRKPSALSCSRVFLSVSNRRSTARIQIQLHRKHALTSLKLSSTGACRVSLEPDLFLNSYLLQVPLLPPFTILQSPSGSLPLHSLFQLRCARPIYGVYPLSTPFIGLSLLDKCLY